MHCRRRLKDHWTESNCIVVLAAARQREEHVLCMRQIIFTAALSLTSPLSQKTGDLETRIGASLLHLMKGKRLVERCSIRPSGSHRILLQEKCAVPHLAGVSLPAVDVREVDFMAVAPILWKTQDLVKLHSLCMI